MGLLGWSEPAAARSVVVADARRSWGRLHRLRRARRSLARADRGRPGAGAGRLAALVLGQPFVAAEVVFIALVGEVLEAWTFARTRRALGRLVDQTPRTARVRRDGEEVEIPAHDVAVGDLVIVRPGERIPVDGTVLAGRSTVDQSALTGESLPIDKGPGDPVFTGTMNQFGVIEVEAEKVGERDDVRPGAPAGRAGHGGRRRSSRRSPTAWRGTSCRWSRSSRARRF